MIYIDPRWSEPPSYSIEPKFFIITRSIEATLTSFIKSRNDTIGVFCDMFSKIYTRIHPSYKNKIKLSDKIFDISYMDIIWFFFLKDIENIAILLDSTCSRYEFSYLF